MPKRPALAEWLGKTNDVTQTFLSAGRIPGLINLAGGLPESETWPTQALARFAGEVIAAHPQDCLGYSPIDGLPELRDAISARFSDGQVTLARDNVLITTGGMQALDLIGKVLLDQGDVIAAQSPAYLGALDAWRPRAPRYNPMVLESNAFDPLASMKGAKFAYTVPNFSNPSGRLVDLKQRQALVQAAQETGTWLLEDDPYAALYYDADPLPRMLSLSGTGEPVYRGPVIYMGTMSKEVAPGLRVGWVIADPDLIAAMTTAKQGSDMFTSGICQRIAYEALRQGVIDDTMPATIDVYRKRRDALCQAMTEHLSELFDWEVPVGGMFVWAVAKDPSLNTDRLMKIGLEHLVCISPSSVFDPLGQDRRAIRLNFTFNDETRLAEGVARLAKAVSALRGR